MKYLFLIVTVASAASCAHRSAVSVPTLSVAGVKSGIMQAQSQLSEAEGTVEQIGGHLISARTRAQQIDGKATVILEHWQ